MTREEFLRALTDRGVLVDHPEACISGVDHRPMPLVTMRFETFPGGPDVSLCHTCIDNYHIVWKLVETYRGNPPWDLYLHIPRGMRALVARSWAASKKLTQSA